MSTLDMAMFAILMCLASAEISVMEWCNCFLWNRYIIEVKRKTQMCVVIAQPHGLGIHWEKANCITDPIQGSSNQFTVPLYACKGCRTSQLRRRGDRWKWTCNWATELVKLIPTVCLPSCLMFQSQVCHWLRTIQTHALEAGTCVVGGSGFCERLACCMYELASWSGW